VLAVDKWNNNISSVLWTIIKICFEKCLDKDEALRIQLFFLKISTFIFVSTKWRWYSWTITRTWSLIILPSLFVHGKNLNYYGSQLNLRPCCFCFYSFISFIFSSTIYGKKAQTRCIFWYIYIEHQIQFEG
jgi:hypothetical protein